MCTCTVKKKKSIWTKGDVKLLVDITLVSSIPAIGIILTGWRHWKNLALPARPATEADRLEACCEHKHIIKHLYNVYLAVDV